MIVVDTSVWIDVLNDRPTEQVSRLQQLTLAGEEIALTDVMLTELLQGARSDRHAHQIECRLRSFRMLRLVALSDFRRAASLYRRARRRGVTIRKSVDCLIVSVCVRERAAILHVDADFDRLAACTSLRTVE